MAQITGISEETMLEIQQTRIHEKVSRSIRDSSWLPNRFRSIVSKAKDLLLSQEIPPVSLYLTGGIVGSVISTLI